MILDINGQPQAGVIGGATDRDIERRYDDRVMPDLTPLIAGSLGNEIGSNYDQSSITKMETLTADNPASATGKVIPWALLAVVGVVVFFMARK